VLEGRGDGTKGFWVNCWNSFACCSAVRPMPVSARQARSNRHLAQWLKKKPRLARGPVRDLQRNTSSRSVRCGPFMTDLRAAPWRAERLVMSRCVPAQRFAA
jgi:hypothetical protein